MNRVEQLKKLAISLVATPVLGATVGGLAYYFEFSSLITFYVCSAVVLSSMIFLWRPSR